MPKDIDGAETDAANALRSLALLLGIKSWVEQHRVPSRVSSSVGLARAPKEDTIELAPSHKAVTRSGEQVGEKFERTPVRVVLSNGEIRYEARETVYFNGRRKRLLRRFRTVSEAEAFLAEVPEPNRVSRYKISDDQYREAIRKSRSIAGALRLLGVVPEGGNYRVLQRAIKRLDLDTSHFTGQSWSRGATVPYRMRPIEDYLSNEYPVQSHRLRQRLINEGILERRCSGCKLDTWMDQPIPLELDHKDGNHQKRTAQPQTVVP